jgi:hypothetical protein
MSLSFSSREAVVGLCADHASHSTGASSVILFATSAARRSSSSDAAIEDLRQTHQGARDHHAAAFAEAQATASATSSWL